MAARMKARMWMAAAVMCLAAPMSQAETLADALIAAYKNSNLLEQNRAVLRATDEDVAGAVATLRPVLAFAGQMRHSDPTMPGVDALSSSLSLSAQITLFDSGRRGLGLDIAKESVLATRQALVNVEQQVLLNAVVAYMNVRSAVEYVALNENSVRVIGESLRAAQNRFDVGEVTRTDVAQAEARLAAARAELAVAQGQLAAAREAYRAATGALPGALAAPPAAPQTAANLDDARALALSRHPAIRQAQHQVSIAELNVALAAAARGPNLTAGAALTLDQDGNDASALTLSFNQPIYQGGGLSAAHRQAIAGRDGARAGLQQAGVTVGYNVAAAWSDLQVARASIVAIDEQIRAAEVAYDGVREEATLGARTTLEVLDAEQELLNARASRVTALANQQIAIYSLLSSMGLMTAEHLQLGIPTYDPASYYNAVKNAPATSVQGQSLDRVLRSIGKE